MVVVETKEIQMLKSSLDTLVMLGVRLHSCGCGCVCLPEEHPICCAHRQVVVWLRVWHTHLKASVPQTNQKIAPS